MPAHHNQISLLNHHIINDVASIYMLLLSFQKVMLYPLTKLSDLYKKASLIFIYSPFKNLHYQFIGNHERYMTFKILHCQYTNHFLYKKVLNKKN